MSPIGLVAEHLIEVHGTPLELRTEFRIKQVDVDTVGKLHAQKGTLAGLTSPKEENGILQIFVNLRITGKHTAYYRLILLRNYIENPRQR